jgi:hypothetical protein
LTIVDKAPASGLAPLIIGYAGPEVLIASFAEGSKPLTLAMTSTTEGTLYPGTMR